MTDAATTVSVRIGRLVLEGASPGDRAGVVEGVHEALAGAVLEWIQSGGNGGVASEHRGHVPPVSLAPAAGGSPSELGRTVGAALAGAVLRPHAERGR